MSTVYERNKRVRQILDSLYEEAINKDILINEKEY